MDSGPTADPHIDLLVTRTLRCAQEAAFDALHSSQEFVEWWPFRARTLNETGAFVVYPIPFVGIEMWRVDADPPRSVCYEYRRGPFRGHGIWTIEVGREPGTINVGYRIKLFATNAVTRFASANAFFRRKYTRDVQRILACLENR